MRSAGRRRRRRTTRRARTSTTSSTRTSPTSTASGGPTPSWTPSTSASPARQGRLSIPTFAFAQSGAPLGQALPSEAGERDDVHGRAVRRGRALQPRLPPGTAPVAHPSLPRSPSEVVVLVQVERVLDVSSEIIPKPTWEFVLKKGLKRKKREEKAKKAREAIQAAEAARKVTLPPFL